MRVCVIGTGRMGRRHIDAARGLGFEIAGIQDPIQAAMDVAVAENSVPKDRCFSDAQEMLHKVKPDGVVIASTAPSHASLVIDAAKAGAKYILCEKPMAVSIAECDEMIKVCKDMGTILAINHQMRFMEQYSAVKAMCESPEFGGLTSITVAASNFGLAMNGCHYFEMFRYMTNEEISEIQFWADQEKVPNPRGAQFIDHSGQLRAMSQTGKRLYMELGGDQGHGIFVTYGCRYGQIFVDELAGHLRAIVRKEEFRSMPTTRYGMPVNEINRQIAPADVIGPTQSIWKAMLENKNYPDGNAGRHALVALVAANISAEKGQSIKLKDILSSDRKFAWA